MRDVAKLLALIFAFVAVTPAAQAEPGTLEVTVTFRERIALPSDAQLDVRLLGVSRTDNRAILVASQRFAITGVPKTVAIAYDHEIIIDQMNYVVSAAIWSGDNLIFRTRERHQVLGEADNDDVEILLFMKEDAGEATAPPRSITGIRWTATEVRGVPWTTDDPATLTIDDDMNFSIFGGCNRFRGELTVIDGEIAFPENFAGTLMACPNDVEAQERTFLEALGQVSGYVRYGAGLVMIDASGEVLLHFAEQAD